MRPAISDGGHERRHFADNGDADKIGDVDTSAKTLQLHCADEGEYRADQAIDDGDDAECPGAGFADELQDIARTGVRASAKAAALRIAVSPTRAATPTVLDQAFSDASPTRVANEGDRPPTSVASAIWSVPEANGGEV